MHAHEEFARLLPWLANETLAEESAAAVRAHLAGCAQCRKDYDGQVRLLAAMRETGPLVFAAEPSFQKLMARIEAGEQGAPQDRDLPQRPEHDRELQEALAPRWGRSRRASAGQRGARARGPTEPGRAPIDRALAVSTQSGVPSRTTMRRRGRGTPAVVRWLAAAVVIEAVALSLGAWVWRAQSPAGAAPYVVLASQEPAYGGVARARVVFNPGLTLDELARLLHAADARIINGPSEASVYTLGFAPSVSSQDGLAARIALLRANSYVLFAEPVTAGNAPP